MPGEGGGPRLETENAFTLKNPHDSPLRLLQTLDCVSYEARKGPAVTGNLIGLDLPAELPPVRRFYELYNVKSVDGGCAFRTSYQLIRALRGNVWLYMDDGVGERRNIVLSSRLKVVYVPPMVWLTLRIGQGAECSVLDSVRDEDADGFDNYEAFSAAVLAQLKTPSEMN